MVTSRTLRALGAAVAGALGVEAAGVAAAPAAGGAAAVSAGGADASEHAIAVTASTPTTATNDLFMTDYLSCGARSRNADRGLTAPGKSLLG
jgi:hypothetical protein